MSHALLQHDRPGGAGVPLPHSAACAGGLARHPTVDRPAPLLRTPCAPADGQDVGAAGASRPAQRRRRPSLRLRERRKRTSGSRGHDQGGADGAERAGLSGAPDAGRPLPARDLARHPGQARPRQRPLRSVGALDRSRRKPAGPADRRDRRAGGRRSSVCASATSGGLRHATEGLPPERGALRRPRCPGLPHPLGLGRHDGGRRQRVQRQGQVSAAGRLLAGRHVRAAGPAHRRDRPSLCGPSAGDPVAAHPGPAVAGQCSGLRGVLRGRRRGGPVAADRGKTTCWRPRSL